MVGHVDDMEETGGAILRMLIPVIIVGLLAWLAYSYVMDAGNGPLGGLDPLLENVSGVDFGDFDFDGLQNQVESISGGLASISL